MERTLYDLLSSQPGPFAKDLANRHLSSKDLGAAVMKLQQASNTCSRDCYMQKAKSGKQLTDWRILKILDNSHFE